MPLFTRYLDYSNGLPIGHTLLACSTSATPSFPSPRLVDILTRACALHIMVCIPNRDATAPSSLRISTHNQSYDLSISSPASSSTSSVFSIDAPSSYSSAPSSSTDSLNAICENDSGASYFSSHYHHQQVIPISAEAARTTLCPPKRPAPRVQPARQLSEAVVPESRQHPRRTQRLTEVDPHKSGSTASCPRPPPSLIRQCERKDNFVDSLVGKLTRCCVLGRSFTYTRRI